MWYKKSAYTVTVPYQEVQYGTVRYRTPWYSIVMYSTIHHGTVPVQYSTISYGTLWYTTIPYGTCMVRYDIWITKGNVITMLIRSFELSKNCSKIRVPGTMMRASELGNTGWEPYIPFRSQDRTMELRTHGNREE